MMKSWNPMVVMHLMAVILAFQTAAEKKKPDNERKPETAAAVDKAKDAAADSDAASSQDEQAIRDLVDKFKDAFNKHDAKAIAEMFDERGEMINSEGEQVRGREDIQQAFADLFEMSPDANVDVDIESIRSLGNSLIIEEGVSCLSYDEDGPREVSRYTVIYRKDGDNWRMTYARDSASEESNAEHIKQLSWLIGEWIDESSDAVVMTTYRWTENHRAIEGEFVIHAPGYPALDGKHRIGWDPQAKQLRSWVFDSEGGFASGLWSRTDEGWLIKMAGVLSDGRTTMATNRIEQKSDDHLTFQSVDRTIGAITLPDGDELSIVRHGPKPEVVSDQRSTTTR